MIPKGTRGQGFKGSSEMLKNYKEQKDMEERQPWITLGSFTYLIDDHHPTYGGLFKIVFRSVILAWVLRWNKTFDSI